MLPVLKAFIEMSSIPRLQCFLSCDGRYEDAAFILPLIDSNTLRDGFSAHARLRSLLEFQKENEFMDEEQRDAMIFNLLNADAKTVHSKQQQQQHYVVNHIIDRNPGLLSKKVLIFPQNERDGHWNVTFVFNPGYICENVNESDVPYHSLQPCFFRYCSSHI